MSEATAIPNIDIRPDHWGIVRDILQKHVPQYAVWAFGSRAKWTAKEYSDLDLAIITDKPLSLDVSASLSDDFSVSDLPWKVDIVDWASTSESFRRVIKRDRVVVQEIKNKGLKTESLVSMCEAIVDCPHSTPVRTDAGYVVLRNQNIKGGRLDLSVPSFTDEAHFKQRIRRMAPRPGDIVITREAPMGEVCKVPDGLTCCLGQRQVLLRPKADVDADYLLYALQSPFIQNQIRWNEGTGSTVSNIRIPILEKIEIPRHDQAETSIAKVLGSLDAKIDLNRRINQTLEAMAQAIFKSWFVDFDPVKAKIAAIEQGQDPLRAAMRAISGKTDFELDQMPRAHHDQLAATAALFPDEMQESELGVIPKGWEVKSLDQIATYLNGLALQKFPPENESEFLPVIKIAQLRAGNTNGADRASARLKPEYIVEDGDVLFSWSGSLEVDVWTGRPGALNQHLFKVISLHVPKWLYFFATKLYLPQFREIAANKATTMGHIQRKHLSDALIAVPNLAVIAKASEAIAPLLDEMIALRLQSRQLAELRDTLLPKLLSGELSVASLEKEGALP